MQRRQLVIMEVSQKQAYIFSSNKLKENIKRSGEIARITSAEYLEEIAGDPRIFNTADNLVYSGGGHTVLEFSDQEAAVTFNKLVTRKVYEEYPLIELFAVVMPYDEDENPQENLKRLIQKLEKKKSIRAASFRQGSFGVEAIDTNTLNPVLMRGKEPEEAEAWDYVPDGFQAATEFGDLGGSKGSSNYIAVIHIDGNGMGARVADFYGRIKDRKWEDFKREVRQFSGEIETDFKAAYRGMADVVAKQIRSGVLDELDLVKNGKTYFPVRKVILSADDVCFVTEGRIALECAATFMEILSEKRNGSDGQKYAACAGAAIVHQKYPFFRAYEISEALCSNAKKFNAEVHPDDNGKSICSIDWHISQGELGNTVKELRSDYEVGVQEHLEMRPYIVAADCEIEERYRFYRNFREVEARLQKVGKKFAGGKVKNLRTELKRGRAAVQHYLVRNSMLDVFCLEFQGIYEEVDTGRIGKGESLNREIYVKTDDDVTRSILFDGIEMMDTFIAFKGKDGE